MDDPIVTMHIGRSTWQGKLSELPMKKQEAVPVAARWGFDGYGWTHYLDNGSGSDWLKRATQHDDVELLYAHPPHPSEAVAEAMHNLICCATPYMRDEAQMLALAEAKAALRALKG